MPKVQIPLPPMVVKAVALAADLESTDVALGADREGNRVVLHGVLRLAIDESGWKHDAIACALAVDGPYLSKMLTGEKPIAARHLAALPSDVARIFARRYAEGFGLLVVTPLSGDDAAIALIGGFVGILRQLQCALDALAKDAA